MKAIDKLPIRHFAHPFDRCVRIEGDERTHSVDRSPDAIGGCYGIDWPEAFRCHRSGELYVVHCNDGVNSGKLAHRPSDLKWMEAMRRRIIARTQAQHNGPIVLSSREWVIMSRYTFVGWLDELHRKNEGDPRRTVGDQSRHIDSGEVGTINGLMVVVDPKAADSLPPVGTFGGEEPRLARRSTRFEGIFAAAFVKAASRAS